MHTVTLSPSDTIALAPAAGGIATAVRRLAGSAFRPHSWPTDPRGSVTAAAAFVARVGFPCDLDSAGSVTIGTHPRGTATHGNAPSLPSRLVIVANAVADAEGGSPQPYLDRAYDLLAGLCLCHGNRRATLLGTISMHGFGFTMSRIGHATEGKVRALFAIDRRNVKVCEGFVTRPQRSLHDGALRVLAAQWEAEAADATLAPLDRARRVAAAARGAASGWKKFPAFGNDECGEALALYAEVAASDDGSEAWARFASAADRANIEREPSIRADGEPSGESMSRADEAADLARSEAESAARTDREDGSSPDADAFASETGAEGKERRARAKTMKAAPKGRSKADQAASESAEAAAVSNGAAAAAEVASRTEGGVDTTASRIRNRAPNGVILAD
jgi:hypothetical protein